MAPSLRRLAPVLVALALVLVVAACSSSGTTSELGERRSAVPATDVAPDPALTRGDVDCTAEGLGSTPETDFTTAHLVVDGRLGALCFGDDDPLLVEAWNELAAITPPGQLTDLALFGGFTGRDPGDADTLAFVNALDDEGLAFQMSVNLPAFAADRDEASLTLAHEFSHVFTQAPNQLDWSVTDSAACTTYFNGSGCFRTGSLMATWIDAFWTPAELATVDPDAEVYPEDGDARCAADDGFFGAYGATTPEEDFAEAFSAYVFGVEAATAGQQRRLDWLAGQPGLVEFRQRAADAGLGSLPNMFQVCG